MMECFKVVTQDLQSVGLLGAVPLQYHLNKWVQPLEPLSNDPRKGGGLWVAPRESHARAMQKYLARKHNLTAKIFRCNIGRIIYQSSCRIKTDKVMLIEEVG